MDTFKMCHPSCEWGSDSSEPLKDLLRFLLRLLRHLGNAVGDAGEMNGSKSSQAASNLILVSGRPKTRQGFRIGVQSVLKFPLSCPQFAMRLPRHRNPHLAGKLCCRLV